MKRQLPKMKYSRFLITMKNFVDNTRLFKKNVSPQSLGLARIFSWISFVVIIIFSIFLSVFIATNTRSSLINSQESYALLLAENMNRQIFRRFTLPVAYASGRVTLSEPDQYRLLDEVVNSLMHGLRIESIRIFDNSEMVAYSTNKEELQSKSLSTQGVKNVFENRAHSFEITSKMSFLRALFTPHLPRETFILRTVYPLTIDYELAPFQNMDEDNQPILGALEIMQDVTDLYKIAIRSQWTILIGFTLSVLILFVLLQTIAKLAERIISERIKRTKQLEAELNQSEKLASMGRMVSSIAHEIRNPLGIIKSSSEYLINRGNMDKTGTQIVHAIYDESKRLSNTVSDFLDYARPRKAGNDVVNLTELVEKVWSFLQTSFTEKNITANIDLPEKLCIRGDTDLLYRAIYNIFINAEQAMERDGTITVTGKQEYDFIYLCFTDSGKGFSGDISQLLDPFFTTKDTGTGLGLPIVQSIIKTHSGELRLKNAEENGVVLGASVEFVLPVSQDILTRLNEKDEKDEKSGKKSDKNPDEKPNGKKEQKKEIKIMELFEHTIKTENAETERAENPKTEKPKTEKNDDGKLYFTK